MTRNVGTRPCCTPSTSSSEVERLNRMQERLNRGVSEGTITASEATTLQKKLDDAQASLGRDGFEPRAGTSAKGKLKAKGKGKKVKGGKKQGASQKKKSRGAPNFGFGESTGASLARARRLGQAQGTSSYARPTYGTGAHHGPAPLRGLNREIAQAARNEAVDLPKVADSIDKRISAGLDDGTLTSAEAESLKTRANALRTELTAAMMPGATPDAQKAVAAKYQQLGREISAERHDAEFDATKRQAHFESRITAGVANGSLTAGEASALREKAKALALPGAQAKDFERVSRSITRESRDAQVDVPVAVASLKKQVEDLKAAGKLPAEQAQRYLATLDEMSKPGALSVGLRLTILRSRLAAFAA
jgi:hypothetical protein